MTKKEEIIKHLDKDFPRVERWKYESYVESFYNWHISEMRKLLERVEKNLNLLTSKGNRLDRFRCLGANAIYNEAIYEFLQLLNDLKEGLK